MTPIHGSCLCGGIAFEITGPLLNPLNCHCSQCRKQHGAAFRSRVRIAAKDFRWLKGEHLIKYYESPRGYQRGFCSTCGSPIINRAGPNWTAPPAFPDTTPQYGIPLALLDDPPVAAGMPCLRRQQGAVVRDHRRSAALRRISAAGLSKRNGHRRYLLRIIASGERIGSNGGMQAKKPVVGVIGSAHLVDGKFTAQRVGERNLRAVAETAGALPLIFAGSPELTDIGALLDTVDGVLLTGARANVHPSRFGHDAASEQRAL